MDQYTGTPNLLLPGGLGTAGARFCRPTASSAWDGRTWYQVNQGPNGSDVVLSRRSLKRSWSRRSHSSRRRGRPCRSSNWNSISACSSSGRRAMRSGCWSSNGPLARAMWTRRPRRLTSPRAGTGTQTMVSRIGDRRRTFTADATTDVITLLHPVDNGQIVQVANAGGALPGGLAAATDYIVRDTTGPDLQADRADGDGEPAKRRSGMPMPILTRSAWWPFEAAPDAALRRAWSTRSSTNVITTNKLDREPLDGGRVPRRRPRRFALRARGSCVSTPEEQPAQSFTSATPSPALEERGGERGVMK